MIELARYEVTGRHKYRGHEPGSVFEAQIPPGAAARAINRGSIRLLAVVPNDLVPGSYRLPLGWPNNRTTERKG